MSLDPIRNFAKVAVSTTYNSGAISIVLTSGHGAKLPDPSTEGAFNLTWFDSTHYPDPSDDPSAEIVRVITRSGDALTIVRGQEGTTASDKTTASVTYLMILALTKKTIDDIQKFSISTDQTDFAHQSFQNVLKNGNFESWSSGITYAPDGWVAGSGTTMLADSTNKKMGTYGASITSPNGVQGYIYQSITDLTYYKGRSITIGGWVKTSTSVRVCLYIQDGISYALSPYHSGSGNWEFLTIPFAVSTSATELTTFCMVYIAGTPVTAYFDGMILVEGSITPAFSAKPLYDDGKTLTLDSINNRIGIKNATPSQALDIIGNIAVTGTVDGVDISTIPSTYVAKASDTMTGVLTVNSIIYANQFITNNSASADLVLKSKTVDGGFTELYRPGSGAGLKIDVNNAGTNAITILDSGNVGIGTASPISTLTVAGTTGITTGLNVDNPFQGLVTIGSSSGGSLVVRTVGYNAGNAAGLGIDGTYNDSTTTVNIKAFGVATNSFDSILTLWTKPYAGDVPTEKMRILGNGNVGIGTASPSTQLQIGTVNDEGYMSAGDGHTGMIINGTHGHLSLGTDQPYIEMVGVDALNRDKFSIIKTNYGGDLAIRYGTLLKSGGLINPHSGGTELLRITKGGNVGIGTTSPRTSLQVLSGSENSINLLPTTMLYNSAVSTDIATVIPILGLGTVHGAGAAIGERLRIGFYHPQEGVSSTQVISSSIDAVLQATTFGHNERSDITFNTRITGSSPGDGLTERLRITYDGNVGIGTSAPQKQLHISSGSNTGTVFPLKLSSYGSAVGILFGTGDGYNIIRGKGGIVYEDGGWNRGKIHFLQNTANDETNPTLADSVVTIQNDGNVGIGTTSPSARLHISTSTLSGGLNGYTNLLLESGDHNVFTIKSPSNKICQILFADPDSVGLGQITYDNNTDKMTLATNGNAAITIDSSRNVGIGTASPNAKLIISDGAAGRGMSFVPSGTSNKIELYATDSPNYKTLFSATANNIGGGIDWIGISQHYGANGIVFGTANGTGAMGVMPTVTAQMVIQASTGNVGIGTASPNAKLELYEDNTYGTNAILHVNPHIEGNVSAIRKFVLGTDNNYANYPGVFIGTGTAHHLHFVVNGGSDSGRKMTIDIAGNVGIGTTNPTSLLHSAGSFALPIVNKTGAYTATISDHTITCDASSASFTITLPTAVGISGRIYVIKKVDSSRYAVTIDGNGSETIDGNLTRTTDTQWESVTIQSNNANWIVI